jgi:hypothetical protein
MLSDWPNRKWESLRFWIQRCCLEVIELSFRDYMSFQLKEKKKTKKKKNKTKKKKKQNKKKKKTKKTKGNPDEKSVMTYVVNFLMYEQENRDRIAALQNSMSPREDLAKKQLEEQQRQLAEQKRQVETSKSVCFCLTFHLRWKNCSVRKLCWLNSSSSWPSSSNLLLLKSKSVSCNSCSSKK